jgi:hypothetical protein
MLRLLEGCVGDLANIRRSLRACTDFGGIAHLSVDPDCEGARSGWLIRQQTRGDKAMIYKTRRALLVPALVSVCAACDDASPVVPRHAQAQESRLEARDHELLLAILARLDTLEARTERGKAEFFARVDSLRVSGLLALAMVPPTGVPPGDPGGGSVSAQIAQVLAKTDSIMALTNFLAEDAAAVWQGMEVCGGIKLAWEGIMKSETEAKAQGEGGVGVKPWDTGAAAWLALKTALKVEMAGGVGVDIAGVEACIDLSNIGVAATLPTRKAAAGPFMSSARSDGPGAAQLEATLLDLTNRFSLTPQSVESALRNGADIVQSGDFAQLAGLTSMRPVPAALQNPLATVKSQLTSIDPVALLCSGGYPGRIGSAVTESCGYILADNLPDIGTFLNLGSNFNNFTDKFSTLCGRFNNVIGRRLVVDADLPWSGSTLNVALFPASWTVQCP